MATDKVLPVVIGVDIGGTNTDAVLLHYQDGVPRVLSEVKEQTTNDVTDGLRRAVLRCLLQAKEKGFMVAPIQINIGTTHFINAIVQQRDLAKVAVLRLCGPVSQEFPPFIDFPKKLADIIRGPVHLVSGGYMCDGKEREAFDEEEFRKILDDVKREGITNIAIIGIFSPIRPDQETRARDIVLEAHPEATVSVSHEIGGMGLLERENATILNESLKPLCRKTINKFEATFETIGVTCPFFLTQNDGTVISSDDVMRLPVMTFASGPTNSMRGAAFLTTMREAIVVDIGGTTSDVGVLTKGFPRNATTHVKVAGVKINFRMPDVVSIGLGGGSYVVEKKSEGGGRHGVEVGPKSAGFNLQNEALVFGDDNDDQGRILTMTDVAVSSGLYDLGSRERVSHLDADMVRAALEKSHVMLENVVDKVKLSKENLPVIVVGGGSIIVNPRRPFQGATHLIIPDHFGVANAIGAALNKVSATVSSIVHLSNFIPKEQMERAIDEALSTMTDCIKKERDIATEDIKKPFMKKARGAAIEKCCEQARHEVISRGANKESLEFLEKSDSVLAYIPSGGLNIKVKIVGDINESMLMKENLSVWVEPKESRGILDDQRADTAKQIVSPTGVDVLTPETYDDKEATRHPKEPNIDAHSGEWILSDWDIECIVIGAGIYGCGGGGSPHLGRLRALKALREGKTIRIIGPERLLQNADPETDFVVAAGMIGSPFVAFEQGLSALQTQEAVTCLKEIYDVGKFKDGALRNTSGVRVEKNEEGCSFVSNYNPVPLDAESESKIIGLISFECAGVNAIEPLVLAAEMNIPVVDADGMTRAFPEIQMFIPYMYGKPPYPASIVGPNFRTFRSVLLHSPHCKSTENYLRDVTIENGCESSVSVQLTASEVLNKTAFHQLSRAWRLGDAVLRARLQKLPVTEVIVERENGEVVISGKVVDVQRETTGGFNKGHLVVEGGDEWSGESILIEFQNEFLVVFALSNDGIRGPSKGCVPDLITLVDSDTGEPIPAEELCYGMRVAVILMPSCDLLRQPEALKYIGPQAFRYSSSDVTFTPFKDRKPTQPIPPPLVASE